MRITMNNNYKSITKKEQKKPFFLLTIDTEPDNLWNKQRNITTCNADYLPRFQTLCEKYGFYQDQQWFSLLPSFLQKHHLSQIVFVHIYLM